MLRPGVDEQQVDLFGLFLLVPLPAARGLHTQWDIVYLPRDRLTAEERGDQPGGGPHVGQNAPAGPRFEEGLHDREVRRLREHEVVRVAALNEGKKEGRRVLDLDDPGALIERVRGA